MENIINLEKLENLRSKSNGYTAGCPACILEGGDSQKMHLSILHDGRFSCAKFQRDKDHNRAILSLVGTQAIEGEVIFKKPEPKIEVSKKWPLDILKGLIRNNDYWNNRGIRGEVCNLFDMGIATKGQLDHRSVNPIFNEKKTYIVGFAGRTIKNRDPKWKILGVKSEFLFPLWLNKGIILDKKEIILVEGVGCVLSLYNSGIFNSICLFGVNISSQIISKLIELSPNKIIISLNNENSNIGINAALKIKKQLLSFFGEEKIVVKLPIKKDFNEMNELEIKNWYKNI